MSERDRDLLVELDAAGIAPFNLRVQAGLLPQGLFPAVSFRPDPAGDFRLTHQFSGKGIELLFGNKGWEDLHCQRDHQHGAEHQDAHIDVSLSASGSQNPVEALYQFLTSDKTDLSSESSISSILSEYNAQCQERDLTLGEEVTMC